VSVGRAQFEVEAEPGPCREDLQRRLILETRDAAGKISERQEQSLTGKGRVTFNLGLGTGVNHLLLYCDDQPTRKLATDSRKLLVRINGLDIKTWKRDLPENVPLVTIEDGKSNTLWLSPEGLSGPWAVETSGAASWFWMGAGQQEGLRFRVWSAERKHVRVTASVEAGPCREDMVRNLVCCGLQPSGRFLTSVRKSFVNRGQVEFDLQLAQGLNDLRLYCDDSPTKRIPTDSRNLLVYLSSLRIIRLTES